MAELSLQADERFMIDVTERHDFSLST